ncbi:MAG: phosphoribosylformylglycinamidine synthase subunit PurQ [Thermoplasmata archaeon]|nr:phosphoribosylformylglycinamidine synthase subunit PurQ [Thermoplasmata archaeon]
MGRRALRVAVLTIEGTNCDRELVVAMRALGTAPEVVHLKQLEGRDVPPGLERRLSEFDVLLIPGGFSGGDYVRAGAIFAARLRASLRAELEEFVRDGHLVGGICNGFQVLTELGLLPGRKGGVLGSPEAALMSNESGHFECRPTYIRWDGGNFVPLRKTPKGSLFMFPVAHAEGKLVLADGNRRLKALANSGQVLFRWSAPDGSSAEYPWNPNGSIGDVAGLTNPEGNVFGLMPHPERHFFRIQAPDWTRSGPADGPGDGQRFLAAVVEHAESLR